MKLPALILVVAAGAAASLGALRAGAGPEENRSRTTYFANGQVDTECALKDGVPDGPCTRFYPDGTKLAEGSYVEGRMEGAWSFWNRDGSPDAERSGTYAGGVRTGG